MAWELGKGIIKIVADLTGLKTGLAEARQETESNVEKLAGLFLKLKEFIIPAGIAASIFEIGKHAIETAESFHYMSQRTGIAVEDLSRLAYVAKLNGISTEEMAGSIRFLNRTIEEAQIPFSDAEKRMRYYGIAVKDSNGQSLNAIQVLENLRKKFSNMADGPEKVNFAIHTFGRTATTLIPILNLSTEKFEELKKSADETGNTISGGTAEAASNFMDQLNMLKSIITGVALQVLPTVVEGLMGFIAQVKALGSELLDGFPVVKLWGNWLKILAEVAIILTGGVRELVNIISHLPAMLIETTGAIFGFDQSILALKDHIDQIKKKNDEIGDSMAKSIDVLEGNTKATNDNSEALARAAKEAYELAEAKRKANQQEDMALLQLKLQLDTLLKHHDEMEKDARAIDERTIAMKRENLVSEDRLKKFRELQQALRDQKSKDEMLALMRSLEDAYYDMETGIAKNTHDSEAQQREEALHTYQLRKRTLDDLLKDSRITKEEYDQGMELRETEFITEMANIDAEYGNNWKLILDHVLDLWKQKTHERMDLVQGLFDATEKGLQDAFFDAMSGKMNKLKDVWAATFDDIKKTIAKFLADQAIKQLIALIPKIIAMLGGSGGGGGGDAWASPDGVTLGGGATGAIFGGSLSPIAAFASGTPMVDRPTLALVGEGKYNEAVVPLPDGRSIPVQMRDGAGDKREVSVSVPLRVQLTSDLVAAMRTSGEEITATVTRDILRRGELYQLIQRVAKE